MSILILCHTRLKRSGLRRHSGCFSRFSTFLGKSNFCKNFVRSVWPDGKLQLIHNMIAKGSKLFKYAKTNQFLMLEKPLLTLELAKKSNNNGNNSRKRVILVFKKLCSE